MNRMAGVSILLGGLCLLAASCMEDPSTSPPPARPSLPGLDSSSPLVPVASIATGAFEPLLVRAGKVYQPGWEGGNALVRVWDGASAWRTAATGTTFPTTWLYHDAQEETMATLAIDATWACPLRVVGPAGTWIPTASKAWKETVSLSGPRVAWVDYRHNPVGGSNSEVYVAHRDSATELRLTDDSLYQTKVVLDGSWAVWVEYVHGTRANIRWMDLATGQTLLLDPRSTHQDNPKVDGGWVVWEDYRSASTTDTTDIDLWGWSPSTGSVPLARGSGFQGGASLSRGRLVWEDHVPGASVPRLRGKPLTGSDTSTVTLVAPDASGMFQGKPALEDETLAWIAASGATMEVRLARWVRK